MAGASLVPASNKPGSPCEADEVEMHAVVLCLLLALSGQRPLRRAGGDFVESNARQESLSSLIVTSRSMRSGPTIISART